MVVAFRRWIDEFTAGEGAVWSPRARALGGHADSTSSLCATPPRASRRTTLERRESHVAHCSACRGALENARRTKNGAEAAAVAALFVAGLSARARAAALALAAIGFATVKACVAVEEMMTVGQYPPPRNVHKG